MLFVSDTVARMRRTRGFSISIATHVVLLIVVCWRPVPLLVQPSSVRFGEHGTSMTPIYFARKGAEDLMPADAAPGKQSGAIRYPSSRQKKAPDKSPDTDSKTQQAETNRVGQHATEGPRAGSPFGSLAEGPAIGEEIKPALPIYGPQPQVASYEIPTGLEGDIVVEITIDMDGNVTQTSLLRGLGHGLDEKVLAILQTWHFHPAMRDGRPIASRQDVYFHFPKPA